MALARKPMCEHILSLDPSGNFNEGKGRTGWVLFSVRHNKIIKFGEIDAGVSPSMMEHWAKHLDLINNFKEGYPNLHIVMEDYLLYGAQAVSQTNSRMETPKMIGVIEYHCYSEGIPLQLQTASSVKSRWKDQLLVNKGYITSVKNPNNAFWTSFVNGYQVSGHVLDAVRHAIHYKTFMIK